jgi:hypothetical protein
MSNADEDNLLVEGLSALSKKKSKKLYGYGEGTANAFQLCGVNRLCDIIDHCDEILRKLDMTTLGISARQRNLCKQCLTELNKKQTSDVSRLINKSRIKNHTLNNISSSALKNEDTKGRICKQKMIDNLCN